MKLVGNHDVLKNNRYLGTHSHYFTISDSDHHLYFDNPEELLEMMFKDLDNLGELELLNP
jgi:hypothetical protein